MNAVKFVNEEEGIIEGMLAPYYGPVAGKDLVGEFFDTETDFALDWFGDWQRPLLYEHGMDEPTGLDVVGRMSLKSTDQGVWMQAQLNKSHKYIDAIKELIKAGRLGLSSGSVDHLVEVTNTGRIKRWPLIEGSLTTHPANPDAFPAKYAVKFSEVVSHMSSASLPTPPSNTDLTIPATNTITITTPTYTSGTAGTIYYPTYSPPVPDITGAVQDAIKAAKDDIIEALGLGDAQTMHDIAVKSGARCEHDTPTLNDRAGGGVDVEASIKKFVEYAAAEAARSKRKPE